MVCWKLRIHSPLALTLAILTLGSALAQASPPHKIGAPSPKARRAHVARPLGVKSTGTLRDILPLIQFEDPDAVQLINTDGEGSPPLPSHGGVLPDAVRVAGPRQTTLLGTDRQMNNSGADVAPGSTQAETAIAAWGKYLAGGWNDGETFGVHPGATGYAYSNDGGATWVDGGAPTPGSADDQYFGDPCIVADGAGNFYFSNLYLPDGNFTAGGGLKSLSVNHGRFDGSGTLIWDPPVNAVPVLPDASDEGYDKEWLAVDRDCGTVYMSYTLFGTAGATGRQIQFVRSTDGGATWSAPIVLSDDSHEYSQGSRPAVGPNHEVYVVYVVYDADDGTTHNRIVSSTDGGLTFGPPTDVDSNSPGGQFYENNTSPFGFNRTSIPQFPSIDVDRSCGEHRGRVYVTWGESVDYYDDPLITGVVVGEANNVANDAPGGAQPINIGDAIVGDISGAGNNDYYTFQAVAGKTYEFTLEPDNPGSIEDGFLRLFCVGGVLPTDNVALSYYGGGVAQIIWTAPSNNVYYVRVRPNSYVAPGGGQNTKYDLFTGVHTPMLTDLARDHRDAMVAYSDDGGATWSVPKVVNTDDLPLFDNTYNEVNVDGTGRVNFHWLDHRTDLVRGIITNTRANSSGDGTATFAPSVQLNTVPTLNWAAVSANLAPNFGDYNMGCTDGMNYYASWADGRNGTPDAFMAQVAGGLTVDCPPCPSDVLCPGQKIHAVYNVCNNGGTPLVVNYHISSGIAGCDFTGSVTVPDQSCVPVAVDCVVPGSCVPGVLTLSGQFAGSAARKGEQVCCKTEYKVSPGAVDSVMCAPDQPVVGYGTYHLEFIVCNSGTCRDTTVCDLGDTQGWLVGGPVHMLVLLNPGECDTLKVDAVVPGVCDVGTQDIIGFNCYPLNNPGCGRSCLTTLTCTGATPVAISAVEVTPDRGAVRLSWSAFVEGSVSRFQVFRSSTRDGQYQAIGAQIDASAGHDFSFRDTGVKPSTEYFYKIGYQEKGTWNYSGATHFTTPAAVFALRPAHPNPFVGNTHLEYEIARSGDVRLEIFNLAGQRVCTLLNSRLDAGVGTVTWNGRSDAGQALPTGTYFARLTAGGAAMNQRMTLIR